MSEPFAPGDVVVCVHLNPLGTKYDGSLRRLKLRGTYRVSDVGMSGNGESLELEGVTSTSPLGMWNSARFSRLPKADPAFTEAMRAIKPIRKEVDA